MLVLDLIHYRLDQADTQATFSFFVNEVAEIRSDELIDIKRGTVINDLEDNRIGVFQVNIQFEEFIGIALVSVNHQIGTHFVQREYHLTDLKVWHVVALERLADEIADTLEVLDAAPNIVLKLLHAPFSLQPPYLGQS